MNTFTMTRIARSISSALTALGLVLGAHAQTWNGTHPVQPGWRLEYGSAVAEQAAENQIFLFGGIDGLSSSASVWRFHRINGWTVLADMPAARHRTAATTVRTSGVDKVHVFGGEIGNTGATSTHWRYDPAADSWNTSLAPLPVARVEHEAVTAPNGLVYVFGGQDASGFSVYNTTHVYNPVTDTWLSGPSMPTPRTRFAAVMDCDGYVYLFGGVTSGGSNVASVDCFDTNASTWLAFNPHGGGAIPPMPTPRNGLAGALGRDGRQYLIGGYVASPVPVYTVESFHPYSNTWDTENPLIQSRGNPRAHGLGSRVWVLGGQRKVNPDTNRVESLGSLSYASACANDVPALPPYWGGLTALTAAALPDMVRLVDGELPVNGEQWFALPASTGVPQVADFTVDGPAAGVSHEFFDAASMQSLQLPAGGPPWVVYAQNGVLWRIRHTGSVPAALAFDVTVSSVNQETPIGSVYCNPAIVNSTGFASSISIQGMDVASARSLRLSVDGLPTASLGYFLVSRTVNAIPGAGGSVGTLCLSGDIGRYRGNVLLAPATGHVELAIDPLNLPGNPPTAATAGDTWNFTYWHRDVGAAGATSNFADAVSVLFR